MSGNIGNSYLSTDDGSQRYREMVERIKRNNTMPSTCETLYESRLGASVQQPSISNGTLTTQQFYNIDSTSTTNQCLPPRAASTNSQVSTNTGMFHLPKTTKQYMGITKYKARMEYGQRDFFNIQDNSKMKLIMRIFENSLYLINTLPPMDTATKTCTIHEQTSSNFVSCITSLKPVRKPLTKEPVEFIDLLAKTVKEKFYLQQLPQMISSASSTSSLQFNTFYHNHIQPTLSSRPASTVSSQMVNNNDDSVVKLSKSSTSTQTMEPVVVVDDINSRSVETSTIGSRLQSRLRNQSQVLPSPNMSINLFDDSQIAIIRDEMAVEQATQQRSWRKPKASTAARPTKIDASIVAQQEVVNQKDISQLPGVKAVSRVGRLIKDPASYWAVAKGVTTNQPTQHDTSRKTKVDLNDTLTLRNSKVVERKTPSNKNGKVGASSSPLSTITENKILLNKSNKSQVKNSQVQDNKENSEIQKKRSTKTKNKDKANVSNESSKENSKVKAGRGRKKAQPVKKPKTPEKKKPVKRKSKEAEVNYSKKKKVEDVSTNKSNLDFSFGDELFGEEIYKKTKSTALQAISPTTGMLSAKKAAGTALSKETPPCKIMGLLMNSSIRSGISTSSAVREGPALNQDDKLVKRVVKKIKNNKTTQKNSNDSKLQKLLDNPIKTSYSAVTPLTTTKYTMVCGMEVESDEDEDDIDEYDDDLL